MFKSEDDQVLSRNGDLFVNEERNLDKTNTVKIPIDTGTHEPIKKCPYHTMLIQRKIVDSAVAEVMRAGIIERSNSPSGFPIILVEKKRC